MSTRVVNERVGFEIGWDFAQSGLRLPPDLHGDIYASVLTGFGSNLARTGNKLQRIKCSPDDLALYKKILYLRLSAFRRSRSISDELTPAYLRRIQVSCCPVTRATFTHGTGQPTDASVERINNNGGYAPGNICFVSLAANSAKGCLSFTEVAGIAATVNHQGRDGLTSAQWIRLACLSSYVCELGEVELANTLPMLCRPSPGLLISSSAMSMRYHSAMMVVPGIPDQRSASVRKAFKSLGSKRVNVLFERFVSSAFGACHAEFLKARAMDYRHLMENSWSNPVLFNAWTALSAEVGERMDAVYMAFIAAVKGGGRLRTVDESGWSLDTRGYAI